MRESTYFILQLGIICLWLISCQPATVSPKSPATFTPTMQPSAAPSATPTLTATATFEGEGRFMGSFGAGYFSGVFHSPDAKQIFVIFNDNELRWYDATSFDQQGSVFLHSPLMSYQRPYQVLFGSNPDRVAVVDYYAVWIIDLKDGKVFDTLSGSIFDNLSDVIFSPDGNALLYRSTHHASGPAAESADSSIGLWNIEKDSQIPFEEQSWLYMTNPVISPDEAWVAAGCGRFVKVWDAQSGKVLRTLDANGAILTGLAISKDGASLITSDQDGKVRLWDSKTGQNLHTFSFKKAAKTIAFMPNDEKILVEFSHDRSKLIDLQTLQVTDALPDIPVVDSFTMKLHLEGFSDSRNAVLAVSPDRKILAVGSGTVLLWDIAGQKVLNTLESTTHADLMEIKFDPAKPKLAVITSDGKILLWDITSTSQPTLATIIGDADQDARQGLSFSPDGTLLAVGHGTDVEIWDVETAQLVKTLHAGGYGNINYVFGTEFLADGHSLYVILDLPELHQYSGRPDRKGIQLWNIEKGQLINQRNLPDSNGYLIAFHWPLLALHNESDVTYADDWIEIWNVQTGKFQKLPASFDIAPVAFSDDLKLLFARDDSIEALYIWQVETGKLAYISKGYSKYYDPTLLGTSNFLASVNQGFVRLFDIQTIIDHARQPDITPVPLPTP